MLAVLREVDCSTSAPLKQKLMALEPLHGKYSVHVLCDALNISRGTFYNHLLRNKRGEAAFQKRRESLMLEIREIFDGSNQIFGAGKIKAILVNRGHKVSEKLVQELMRTLGIASVRTATRKDYITLGWHERKTNVLMRNFDVKEPNAVWVSDMTFFKYKERFYTICVFLDLFSRKVLSISIGKHGSTRLVTRAFLEALSSRETSPTVLHSDQGVQYASHTMLKLCRKMNVKQSFSKPGSPHDNAVMESFFSTLKKEELYRTRYKSETEFRKSLKRYAQFYNSARPHKYLNYKTPAQVEKVFF
jgi:transposase InsO family protein